MYAVPLRCILQQKEILILGIGNILQKDDGIGVHIINELQNSWGDIPENVEIVDGGTIGLDLLPVMKARKKIIIVDALKNGDLPGSIYRFPADHLVAGNNILSLHEIGVKRIIDMLNLMGDYPEIEIIGVVPEDISSLEIGLSDSLKEKIPVAIECILEAAIS